MIRIKQIKIPIEDYNQDNLKKFIVKKLKCKETDIKEIHIKKQSLDARKKDNISYVFEVDIKINNEKVLLNKYKNNPDIIKTPNEEYIYPPSTNRDFNKKIVIVGSGPSGLFCAYILAELGYSPLIIERGEKMEDRINSVEKFWRTGELNENSNVQFGEGGAGTFSDGKLNTLTKDKEHRHKKVLEIFSEMGASPEIKYIYNPHIGTDVLRNVIKNMRNKITEMGGTFYYNSTLTDIIINDNIVTSIVVNNDKVLETDVLVLAIGHSARDTFEMLLNKEIKIEPKPFAVGLRIQHPQELISISQYGSKYKLLPPASYKLTYQTKEKRGVYTFCMCPGGYVVNASSEKGKLAINGMSNYNRDTKNANSAIIVTVGPKDYGNYALDGMKFQRNLEEKMYKLASGKIPVQTIKDFYENKKTEAIGSVSPVIKGEYQLSNLNDALPSYLTNSIKEALPEFAKKIKHFDMDDALLAGIESRTSSPVRISRDENYETNIKGIYPCGEGAGYAGGITTSAIDGIKVAEKIIKNIKS